MTKYSGIYYSIDKQLEMYHISNHSLYYSISNRYEGEVIELWR